jgi:hypothetical protein
MSRIAVFAAIIFLFSCTTHKVITKTVEAPPPKITEHADVIDSVHAHAFQFEYFTAKAKIVVDHGDNHTEFTANFRVKNDSAIWVSISPALGLEAARVLMTGDSVRVIDRLHHEKTSHGYDFFQKYTSLPVTLQTMQQLVEGNPVFTEGRKFVIIQNDTSLILTSHDELLQDSLIFSNRFLPQQQILVDTSGMLYTSNGGYDIQYTPPFSLLRKIVLLRRDEVLIEITFSRVKLNEPVKFPFRDE